MMQLPPPPYYAVIFTSKNPHPTEAYQQLATEMVELAEQQPGYLSHESYRNADGAGCTISYWTTTEAIKNWKNHSDHQIAQKMGKEQFYEEYIVRIAKVERQYTFST